MQNGNVCHQIHQSTYHHSTSWSGSIYPSRPLQFAVGGTQAISFHKRGEISLFSSSLATLHVFSYRWAQATLDRDLSSERSKPNQCPINSTFAHCGDGGLLGSGHLLRANFKSESRAFRSTWVHVRHWHFKTPFLERRRQSNTDARPLGEQ